MALNLRPLGSQGFKVPRLGFGCMGLSAAYGKPVDEDVGIDVIKHVIDSGVTFLDTSDIYGPFTNELLVGKALKHFPRAKIQLATKFGSVATDSGGMIVKGSADYVREACEPSLKRLDVDYIDRMIVKGSADYVREACEASLKRLDVDYIDLYYQHRVDTTVPIEETVGALKKLVEEGKVKYIGLSEASAETIRRAHAVHPITAVQLEWSLWTRDVEEEIVPTCRELGIGIVAYSPLGNGFFSGKAVLEKLESTDARMLYLPSSQHRKRSVKLFYYGGMVVG